MLCTAQITQATWRSLGTVEAWAVPATIGNLKHKSVGMEMTSGESGRRSRALEQMEAMRRLDFKARLGGKGRYDDLHIYCRAGFHIDPRSRAFRSNHISNKVAKGLIKLPHFVRYGGAEDCG